ncbi:MAG TPA: TonB-dependent receptor [Terriglobales bacterium]|nr:TonB-dependent receptor [Terriglobales bacterium]
MNSLAFIYRCARSCFWVCLLTVFAATAAFAQAGRGSISGTVTDPSGAVIPRAQVVLLDRATGTKQHTVTNAAGLYSFISLNPGEYHVTASQTGFASVARDKVAVTVDQTTVADIALRVGTTTEAVTVTEGVDLVEPTSSTVGTLIPSEAIDRVPLLYRNVYDLIQLSAGVIPVNGSPNSSDSMQSVQNISVGRPGIDVSADTINGAINGSVYYMVDGSPIGIAENNSAAILPAMNIPEDAVEEVRVETQNTPATYQSGAAGVISLVSKSGTNQFHGDAFGIFRPNALSANEYFNKQSELSQGQKNTPPDFHRYQAGGAIGGPIKRDKLFFFGDYEYTDQQQFEGVDFFTVPTTAERTGDFSHMGFPIYDPTKPDLANGQRQPFPGNKIPNPNPIALNFLSHFPHCNIPDPVSCDAATSDVSNNFGLPGLDPFKAHRFDVRVDWNQSEKQRIFTRFSYDHLFFTEANVFNNMWDPNYAQNVTNARNVVVGDDLTINSSTVLQLRYSFTRHHENQGGDPRQIGTDLASLGFQTPTAADENFQLLPIIVFNDYPSPGNQLGGTGNYNTFLYASENSDVSGTVNKVWRKHQISTGFEWMKRYLNVGQPPNPSGAYGFDITATERSLNDPTPVGGSDFASFLIGMGMTASAEPGVGYNANFSKDIFLAGANAYYSAFLEDTFHALKTLTITAGLRWDIFGGRTERFNRLEYFNPTVTNTVSGVPYTGAEVYANGNNRSPFTTNLHNFGPRLGFAWQPIQHLVVRGGAGFYYGPSPHNVSSAIDSDGFSSSTPWVSTCFNADGNTVFNGAGCGGVTAGPVDNFTVPYSLTNPFPTGVIPTFTSPPPGLANNLGISLSTVLRSQHTPTTYNYNFGLEYELPHQVIVSAGYVGSRGLFLPFVNVDLNELDLGTIAKYGSSLCITNDPSCSTAPNRWANLPGAFNGVPTVPLWFAIQPYPQFGNGSFNGSSGLNGGNGVIVWGYAGGDSEYSSLQMKVQKRLTNHFTTLATFTWGKLITDDGVPPLQFVGQHSTVAQDWRDLRYEHSVSPQDVKYNFSGQVSYDLPVGSGRAVNLNGVSNAIAGGWTINGILYLGTGIPIESPTVGAAVPYFDQRPDMICNPATGAPHTTAAWFNPNCFAIPASPFVPGTARPFLDGVRTMGARELDVSIYKTFRLGENKELRFDVSSYNLPNKAQFGYPNVPTVTVVSAALGQTPPSTANFGQITNTINTPRQFQFGARFSF